MTLLKPLTTSLSIQLLLLGITLLSGCSMGKIVARSSTSILDGGVDAMNRETDLLLAEQAIPANIKLMEGLITEDPDNQDLRVYTAQAFYGYAYGFVELADSERAKALYQRGFDHAGKALQRWHITDELLQGDPDKLHQAVSKLNKSAVPALFWAASNWAKRIDLDRTNPTSIAELASTEILMRQVLKLQPDYYYGGASLFYGVYYGSRAPMFGGDFTRADANFSAARKVSNNRLLLIDVLQAEYLERQRFDQAKFHQLLTEVANTPQGHFPEMALANQIARARARYLLIKEEEWF